MEINTTQTQICCASSDPALSTDSQKDPGPHRFPRHTVTAALRCRMGKRIGPGVSFYPEPAAFERERCVWYKHVKHTDRDITLEFTTSCLRKKVQLFFFIKRGKDKDRHLRCQERKTDKDGGTEKKGTQFFFCLFSFFFHHCTIKRTKSHPFSCSTIYCVYGLRKLRRRKDGCSSFTRWCLWTKGTLNGTTFKCSPIHYSTNTMGAHLHTGSVSRTIRGGRGALMFFPPRRDFASRLEPRVL